MNTFGGFAATVNAADTPTADRDPSKAVTLTLASAEPASESRPTVSEDDP